MYTKCFEKNITLNGKKADGSEKLNIGDEVKLFFSDETFEKFTALENSTTTGNSGCITEKYPCIPLDIVYEDADILVINKPVGMLSESYSK